VGKAKKKKGRAERGGAGGVVGQKAKRRRAEEWREKHGYFLCVCGRREERECWGWGMHYTYSHSTVHDAGSTLGTKGRYRKENVRIKGREREGGKSRELRSR
jgi:hypothetical protein